MENVHIKQAVKEKYGQAALKIATEGCCGSNCDPITVDLYDAAQTKEIPDSAVADRLDVGIQPRWHSSKRAKSFWTWVLAAALMFCFRRNVLDRTERLTAWT